MKTTDLQPEVKGALETILAYLECERADYEATPKKERRGHIYEAVSAVSEWLAAYLP